MFLVDLEHESERDGTSDHASEPHKDLLLESELRIIFAEFQEEQESYHGDKAAHHDHEDFDHDKRWAPSEMGEAEEGGAKIDKHECLHEE